MVKLPRIGHLTKKVILLIMIFITLTHSVKINDDIIKQGKEIVVDLKNVKNHMDAHYQIHRAYCFLIRLLSLKILLPEDIKTIIWELWVPILQASKPISQPYIYDIYLSNLFHYDIIIKFKKEPLIFDLIMKELDSLYSIQGWYGFKIKRSDSLDYILKKRTYYAYFYLTNFNLQKEQFKSLMPYINIIHKKSLFHMFMQYGGEKYYGGSNIKNFLLLNVLKYPSDVVYPDQYQLSLALKEWKKMSNGKDKDELRKFITLMNGMVNVWFLKFYLKRILKYTNYKLN